MELIFKLDHQLFFLINNGLQNPVFDAIMPIFTRLGEIWLMLPLLLPLLYFGDQNNFKKHLILLAGGLILSALAGRLVKYLVDRPRPLKEMSDLILAHKVYVHVLGAELREYSFPSGHTISAFSAATFLSFLFRRGAPLFFFIAILTGLSRIYVGAHFPLDVLGGMTIGISVTAIFCFLADRYYFKILFQPSGPCSEKGKSSG